MAQRQGMYRLELSGEHIKLVLRLLKKTMSFCLYPDQRHNLLSCQLFVEDLRRSQKPKEKWLTDRQQQHRTRLVEQSQHRRHNRMSSPKRFECAQELMHLRSSLSIMSATDDSQMFRSHESDAASTSTASTLLKGKQSTSSSSGHRFSVAKVIDKAKAKVSKREGQSLPDDEEDFEKQRAKEVKKEQRKADYERLGLDERVKFGTLGAGGFNSM